ncbi:MAG: ABC transporter ATP-binding protein [Ruminococcaceae bacterium]|nr:ABC transporter ATP-binding protein [Oscillospiraceae bacterium]
MAFHYGRGDLDNPYRRPKPKSLKEVPVYIRDVTKDFFKRLFYMYTLVWEASPWMLFLMIFMAVFNGVTPVIGAQIRAELLNRLADAYVGDAVFQSILTLLVTLFVFNFTVNIITTVNNLIRRITNEVVVHYIKLKIMRKAKTVDLASFDMPEFYAKLENANREAGTRPMDILNSSFSLVSTLISMFSFITILWGVSPAAPGIIILFAIPSAAVNFVYRAKNVKYIRERSRNRREMSYFGGLVTNHNMVKEIKLYNLADVFIGRFDEVFKTYYHGHRRLIINEQMWHMLMTVLRTGVNCGLFLYIAKKVCDGILKVGDYSLYTGALNSIGSGVTSFINTTATIYEGTLFIENMISFMEEETHIRPSIAEPAKPQRGIGHTIELRDVSFRYPGTERDVISHVNLTIRSGETMVLVGLNGAGKTTLIKLITRLYDPTEGVILLDGRDIREYDVEALYQIFGIIFQDFGKYAVTVAENIHYGEISRVANDEDIRRAARQSNAADYIESLPEGYDTPLMRIFDENGTDLSGGQWQKLAIARAFFADADFLILDEPTSALDPMAEQEIYNEFGKLSEGKTTIFVSHRLSSATTASKIVVLEYGQKVEEGTHTELMELKGKYYTLFTTQAQRYIESTSEEEFAERRRRRK